MGPGQRLSARQARSAPLVAAFGDWLQLQCRRISMKSRLGEKLAYIHRHWDGLQTFLHDGRVEIDSNSVENLIRPIALTRKNALFAGHDEGGRSWARIASLIATAKVNGVEPSPTSRQPWKLWPPVTRKRGSTICCLGTSSRQAESRCGAAAAYALSSSSHAAPDGHSASWRIISHSSVGNRLNES